MATDAGSGEKLKEPTKLEKAQAIATKAIEDVIRAESRGSGFYSDLRRSQIEKAVVRLKRASKKQVGPGRRQQIIGCEEWLRLDARTIERMSLSGPNFDSTKGKMVYWDGIYTVISSELVDGPGGDVREVKAERLIDEGDTVRSVRLKWRVYKGGATPYQFLGAVIRVEKKSKKKK